MCTAGLLPSRGRPCYRYFADSAVSAPAAVAERGGIAKKKERKKKSRPSPPHKTSFAGHFFRPFYYYFPVHSTHHKLPFTEASLKAATDAHIKPLFKNRSVQRVHSSGRHVATPIRRETRERKALDTNAHKRRGTSVRPPREHPSRSSGVADLRHVALLWRARRRELVCRSLPARRPCRKETQALVPLALSLARARPPARPRSHSPLPPPTVSTPVCRGPEIRRRPRKIEKLVVTHPEQRKL